MRCRFATSLGLIVLLATVAARADERATRVIVLVRHGEKAAAPADDAVLSDAGRARADALAAAVGDAHVDAIITTQFARTRLTAKPLAEARHLTPIVIEGGGDIAAHVRATAAAVRAQPAGLIVVVGHSNTIAPLIAALGGPTLPDICDGEYSRLFTLVLPADGPSRLIQSHYGAPDPAEPCGRRMGR